MYSVHFYKDKNGNEPVKEYIKELASKGDKSSRINLCKIRDYIKILGEYGIGAGEPYVKHLKGKIWELRPLKNRILFFAYDGRSYILLSYFIKNTQKTPKKEIEKAEKFMREFEERGKNNE